MGVHVVKRLIKILKGIRLEDVTDGKLHPCYLYHECGKAGIYGGHLGDDMERKVVACKKHAKNLKGVR